MHTYRKSEPKSTDSATQNTQIFQNTHDFSDLNDLELSTAATSSHFTEGLRDLEGLGRTRKESAGGANCSKVENTTKSRFARLSESQRKKSIEESEDAEPKWQRQTFGFARYLKGRSELMALTANEAFELIPWEITPFEEEDQLNFLVEWEKVRFVQGVGPVDWAVRMARENKLIPPGAKKGMKTYGVFLSIAGWLQVLVGGTYIILPCRKIGEAMGVSARTVSTLRQAAIKDGLLVVVKDHVRQGPDRRGEPTRFRFAVERYPGLTQRQ